MTSRGDRRSEPADDYTERLVQVRRVTKVVKGGKQLSFRAVVVVGDGKGSVGVGCASAKEVDREARLALHRQPTVLRCRTPAAHHRNWRFRQS